MRPDDLRHALDVLASEVPRSELDASGVVARGRRRVWRRRTAIGGTSLALVAAVAIVAAAAQGSRTTTVAAPTPAAAPRTSPEFDAPPYEPPSPIDLAIPSPTEGWLCGKVFAYTDDGGRSFRTVAVPRPSARRRVFQAPLCSAIPGGEAWAVTGAASDPLRAEITHIEDGGRRLHSSLLPRLPRDGVVLDVTFSDSKHGWALTGSFSRDLYATADGGRTWTAVDHHTPVTGSLSFSSPDDGWAVNSRSGASELERTTDGGHTWYVTVPIPPQGYDYRDYNQLRDLDVTPTAIIASGFSSANGFASDRRVGHAVFDVSTDGGRTWATGLGPTGRVFDVGDAMAFSATDAAHWQFAAENALWTTADAGRTWNKVAELSGIATIQEVSFPTPSLGFVSATGTLSRNATVVLETRDRGRTWTDVTNGAPPRAAT